MTEVFFLLPILPALVLWLWGVPAWRERRRQRLRQAPIPKSWQRVLQRRVPYLRCLPPELRQQLLGHVQVFLAEKGFIGCRGQPITQEVRLTIAAQACLLLLNHPQPTYFPKLRQVLVYPGAFWVDRRYTDEAGVVTEGREVLSGESWSEGQVILAWDEVRNSAAVPDDGYNVVLHEFAHQLDQENGPANGAPSLPSTADRARWSAVMEAAFAALRQQVAQGEDTLLGDYAASEPAEFFAVASEVFFEQPHRLREAHSDLYAALAHCYRVDPAAWVQPA